MSSVPSLYVEWDIQLVAYIHDRTTVSPEKWAPTEYDLSLFQEGLTTKRTAHELLLSNLKLLEGHTVLRVAKCDRSVACREVAKYDNKKIINDEGKLCREAKDIVETIKMYEMITYA
ncbi:hypothetical protein MFLAVUS_010570 [Mucor flavus]|uniref:Uncharacterized protein n=1 Tax=Mucor flavus TaxID=439312 RepID=A0ABP9ZD88_9FUNG